MVKKHDPNQLELHLLDRYEIEEINKLCRTCERRCKQHISLVICECKRFVRAKKVKK